ncbi:MAG: phBC6A51 family helix-turn-helix protein [Candidatus Paceibacterota bacterium]
MNEKQKQTIDERIEKNKEKILEILERTPVVQVACERAGISRATLYRWKKEDKEFAKKANKAIGEGTELVNDMAVSQLISAIKDKNIGAIRFWLQNNDARYTNKLEVSANIRREDIELTPEQEAIVKRALELATLPKLNQPQNHEPGNKTDN